MNQRLVWLLGALALGASFASMAALAVEADDDLARSFRLGRAHSLRDGSLHEESIETAWPLLLLLLNRETNVFRATVVYLHGCDGIGAIGTKTAELLAAAGYLVLVPDSFARRDKPTSCNALAQRGGLHRGVLGWRQAEAAFALTRARTLPGAAKRPLVLMGFSEGAIAAATIMDQTLDARVIEGWTCHAGWHEYLGLKASPEEAVLALVGQDDPWYTAEDLHGDCGAFMGKPSERRRSVVFRPPHPAASQHDLLWNLDARQALLVFLDALAVDR